MPVDKRNQKELCLRRELKANSTEVLASNSLFSDFVTVSPKTVIDSHPDVTLHFKELVVTALVHVFFRKSSTAVQPILYLYRFETIYQS